MTIAETDQPDLDTDRGYYDQFVDRLESMDYIQEVAYEVGREYVRIWVTFDQQTIPPDFGRLHGLKFETAYLTHRRYSPLDYAFRPTRIEAQYLQPIDEPRPQEEP